jgi:4-amino-4-deoxy-L-arabinose transferase-like glycosyltransferase
MPLNNNKAILLLNTKSIILLSILSGFVFILSMNMKMNVYDEAIIAVGANQIMAGKLPHIEFYFNYGPAQIGLLATVFGAFGKSLIVARLYDIAIRTGIVIACGFVLRQLRVDRRIATAALGVQILLLFAAGQYLYVIFPTLLLALVGTQMLAPATRDGRESAGRLIASGAVTGVIALFRYDVGFFVMVAHAVGLALLCASGPQSWRATARVLSLYIAGISFAFLPCAIVAVAAGAGPGFWHDIILYPSQNYAAMRGLPFPMPALSGNFGLSLAVYAPVPAAIIAAWFLADRHRHEGDGSLDSPPMRLVLLLAVLTLAMFAKGVVRVSLTHMLMSIMAAVPVLALLITQRQPAGARHSALVVAGMITISAVAALGLKGREDLKAPENLLPLRLAGATPVAMQRACPPLPALGLGTLDADSYGAACYLAAHTAPDEKIFVGAGRHDKVFISNMALYFAAGRAPVSRWYHFDPGLQTRADVQSAIIAELDNAKVRFVARDETYDTVEEPNQSAVSSGVRLLDQYLAKRYRLAARFGQIAIYRRSGA